MKPNFARQQQTKDFKIDYTSNVDNKRYFGTFTSKKLTMMDIVAFGTRKAQLCGGLHYDASSPGHGIDYTTDQLSSQIAHLEIAIVSAPPWWNVNDIADSRLMALVYKEVISFENSFHRNDREESNAGSEGNSSSEAQVSDEYGGPRPVVAAKVQAALEP